MYFIYQQSQEINDSTGLWMRLFWQTEAFPRSQQTDRFYFHLTPDRQEGYAYYVLAFLKKLTILLGCEWVILTNWSGELAFPDFQQTGRFYFNPTPDRLEGYMHNMY